MLKGLRLAASASCSCADLLLFVFRRCGHFHVAGIVHLLFMLVPSYTTMRFDNIALVASPLNDQT